MNNKLRLNFQKNNIYYKQNKQFIRKHIFNNFMKKITKIIQK